MLIYNSSSKRKVEKNVETESKQSSGPSKKLLLFNVTFSELQVSGSSFFKLVLDTVIKVRRSEFF